MSGFLRIVRGYSSLPSYRYSISSHQPIVFTPRYSPDPGLWPEHHTFPMYKFVDTSRVLLRNLVKSSDDFFDPLVDSPLQIKHLHEPLGPHEEKYIERLMAGKLTKEERRIIGFRDDLVDVVLERTVNECKGTYLTAKLAQQFGLASNIAGGTHHASRVGGSGFTIVNDLAIASFMLLNEGVGKILVVDCDVHAGDGTNDRSMEQSERTSRREEALC